MIPIRVQGACLAAAVLAIVQQTAPESIYFVPSDEVAMRTMADVPAIDLVPGLRVRTVVGTTASVSIGDFEPGAAAPLHHHEREQGDITITGTLDVVIGTGGRVERLGPGAGIVVPGNVAHSIANTGKERMTVIEFHTVRRPDLVPPKPAMTFPASAKSVEVPASRQLVFPLDRPGPGSPNAANMIAGETCTMAWRRLSNAEAVEINAGKAEYFIYLVRGSLRLAGSVRLQIIQA